MTIQRKARLLFYATSIIPGFGLWLMVDEGRVLMPMIGGLLIVSSAFFAGALWMVMPDEARLSSLLSRIGMHQRG